MPSLSDLASAWSRVGHADFKLLAGDGTEAQAFESLARLVSATPRRIAAQHLGPTRGPLQAAPRFPVSTDPVTFGALRASDGQRGVVGRTQGAGPADPALARG